MKKTSLIATAVLAAVAVNAGDKTAAETKAATKEVKKATPAKTATVAKGKKGIQKVTLSPEMLKKIQMRKPKPIDWSFLPETVAEVGGNKITKKQLISFFEKQIKMMPYPVRVTTEQVKKFAPQLVDQMVSQQLLTGLASKAGFKPSAKMVEDSIKAKLKELKPAQLAMMKQQMVARKTTVDQFIKKQAENPMIQTQYAIGEWVKSKTKAETPTDAEIKAFYDKNKDNAQINQMLQLKMSGDPVGTVRASHILIKSDKDDKAAKAKAEEILAKLNKGEKFEDLAKANSTCGSAKNGGSLGAFKKGQMVKEFEEAAFSLKVGETSKLVKTKFGYHIIRRDKTAETKYFPYATVKDKIAKYLSAQKERNAFSGFIKKELAKAKTDQKVKIMVK